MALACLLAARLWECLDTLSRCPVRTLITGHKGRHVMVEVVQSVLSFRVQGQGDRSTILLRPASSFDRQQSHLDPRMHAGLSHLVHPRNAEQGHAVPGK